MPLARARPDQSAINLPDTDEPESRQGSAGPDAAPEAEGKVVLIIDDEPSAHDI